MFRSKPAALTCAVAMAAGCLTASLTTGLASAEEPLGMHDAARRISAGIDRTTVALPDGQICVWGSSGDDQYLFGTGDEQQAESSEPICWYLPGNEKAVAVASGDAFTVALTKAGNVYTWGYGESYGALGLGKDRNRIKTPTLVTFPTDVKVDAIAAGAYHVLALTDEGEIYAWGNNDEGQLCMSEDDGNAGDIVKGAPMTVGAVDLEGADGGEGYGAQDVDEGAYGAGDGEDTNGFAGEANDSGPGGGEDAVTYGGGIVMFADEGDDDNNDDDGIDWTEDGRPRLVTKVPAGVTFKSVAAGENHSLALGSDHKVYACGSNGNGQLGMQLGADENGRSNLSPIGIPEDDAITEIAAGGSASAAVAGGRVYRWGRDSIGGDDGTGQDVLEPIAVPDLEGIDGISVSADAMAAWTAQGDLYTWGDDSYDLLGNVVNKGNKSTPTLVPSLRVAAVSMGRQHAVAVGRDGRIYTWGNTDFGRLGGDSTDSGVGARKIEALEGTPIEEISAGMNFALARTADHKLYGWGQNANSQLGVSGVPMAPIPREISIDGGNVTHIAAGNNHSLAVTNDNRVWAWGSNQSEQLGDKTQDDGPGVAEPVDVPLGGPQPEISQIAAGVGSSLVLLANGDIWVWGGNESGQLGVLNGNVVVNGSGDLGEALLDPLSPHLMPPVCTYEGAEGARAHAVEAGNSFTVLLLGDSSAEAPENANQSASQVGGLSVAEENSLLACGFGSWKSQVAGRYDRFWDGGLGFPLAESYASAAAAGQRHLLLVSGKYEVLGMGSAGEPALGCNPGETVTVPEPTSVGGEVQMGCFSTPEPGIEGVPAGLDATDGQANAAYRGTIGVSMADENLGEGAAECSSEGENQGQRQAECQTECQTECQGECLAKHPVILSDDTNAEARAQCEVECQSTCQPECLEKGPLRKVSTGYAVSVGSPVKAVAAGDNFSMALLESGDVFTWGNNGDGRLGRDTGGESTNVPGKVVGLPQGIVQIDAGDSFAVALAGDGSVYTWGANDRGQLGRAKSSWVPTARVDLVFWKPFEEPGSNYPGNPGNSGGSGNGSGGSGDLCDPSDPDTLGYPGPCYPDGMPGPGGSSGAGDPSGAGGGASGPGGAGGADGQGDGAGAGVGDGIGGENGEDEQLGVSGAGTHGLKPPGGEGAVAQNPPGAARAAITRFGTRFKTVVIPVGTTAKVRVQAYGPKVKSGTRAKVGWRIGNSKVAAVAGKAKSGSKTWRVGAANTLKVKARAPGRTTLKLTAPGARAAAIQVKVVPRRASAAVRRVTLEAPRALLSPGQSMTMRPYLEPAGAARASGLWTSTNPAVATVNQVGRVTAKSKGKAVIVLKVGGKTASKALSVR